MDTNDGLTADQVMTLEAYADTIIPGEKRDPTDRAVAGEVSGGGAVASGAVELMLTPEGGLAGTLDSLAEGLNEHARHYAGRIGLDPDPTVPPFVALAFADRVALARSCWRRATRSRSCGSRWPCSAPWPRTPTGPT